jgi:hypothetical protein
VIQYNKRDLDGTDSEILPMETLEKDLNSMLKVPSFTASALRGAGVFETLRAIAKLVVKDEPQGHDDGQATGKIRQRGTNLWRRHRGR